MHGRTVTSFPGTERSTPVITAVLKLTAASSPTMAMAVSPVPAMVEKPGGSLSLRDIKPALSQSPDRVKMPIKVYTTYLLRHSICVLSVSPGLPYGSPRAGTRRRRLAVELQLGTHRIERRALRRVEIQRVLLHPGGQRLVQLDL